MPVYAVFVVRKLLQAREIFTIVKVIETTTREIQRRGWYEENTNDTPSECSIFFFEREIDNPFRDYRDKRLDTK